MRNIEENTGNVVDNLNKYMIVRRLYLYNGITGIDSQKKPNKT
ncbi:hypothetical protein [uncultured Clostridium sp.]|nr:hypothetical protein [uncultured Clostridium sp.]